MTATLPRSAPALLHPITLGALAVWAVNDHVLKGWASAGLTGKLSDVAALVVCPLVLFGMTEWVAPRLVWRRPGAILAGCCAAIGLLLVGLELSPPVELGYRHALAGAQLAAKSALALLLGQPLPGYRLVSTTPDVTDLFCLPALGVAWWLASRTGGLSRTLPGPVARPPG